MSQGARSSHRLALRVILQLVTSESHAGVAILSRAGTTYAWDSTAACRCMAQARTAAADVADLPAC